MHQQPSLLKMTESLFLQKLFLMHMLIAQNLLTHSYLHVLVHAYFVGKSMLFISLSPLILFPIYGDKIQQISNQLYLVIYTIFVSNS